MSKKFSKEPEKFGTGHIEGIVDFTSANNSALGGAWIPALVFGIPGDSITAIVIGVLYMKNMNPGPTVFLQNPQFIYAVFLIFILANILMLPFGWAAIKIGKQILRVPRNVLLPIILIFCVVGSYAMTNSVYGIIMMLVMGVIGWLMEEHGFPIAPAILGLVLGEMLEQNFMTSMIKSDGALLAFFERPDRRHPRGDHAPCSGPACCGIRGGEARYDGAGIATPSLRFDRGGVSCLIGAMAVQSPNDPRRKLRGGDRAPRARHHAGGEQARGPSDGPRACSPPA